MSGSLVNLYSQLDSNILEMQLTLDQTRKGMHAVSLTNYDNTSLPAIAAGSVIEVDGALYKFASEEAIGGSPSDGTVYIKIIPSTITAEFTNTAPTWSDSKQGWYGTTTSATHRYLEFVMTKAAAVWSNKRVFNYFDNIDLIKHNNIPCCGFMVDGTALFSKLVTVTFSGMNNTTAAHEITFAYSNHRIISISPIKLNDTTVDRDADETYVSSISWDDTNITMSLVNVETKVYTLYIVYK